MNNWLIIGVGNRYRQDDSIGLLIADRLKAYGFNTSENPGDGGQLINLWQPDHRVIIVDAVISGRAAGELIILNLTDKGVPNQVRAFSSHQFGIAQGIELARTLGQLPSELWFLGIEGKAFDYGASPSEPVNKALSMSIKWILEIIDHH